MATTVTEKYESRKVRLGDRPQVDLVYVVDGTSDDVAATAAALAAAPTTYTPVVGVTLVRESSDMERIADDAWEFTITYGYQATPDTGDSDYTFETGGGSSHITQALYTVGSYAPAGQTAPDFKGAINVTKDSVDGVDIVTPKYQFSETHYINKALVTSGYRLALFYLTGSVNNGIWRGFASGELLFLGASGSTRGTEMDWQITYRFVAIPNVVNLAVGDMTILVKRGHDYLSVYYADVEDTSAKRLVKRPVGAHVYQVYWYRDFSLLGIGS